MDLICFALLLHMFIVEFTRHFFRKTTNQIVSIQSNNAIVMQIKKTSDSSFFAYNTGFFYHTDSAKLARAIHSELLT